MLPLTSPVQPKGWKLSDSWPHSVVGTFSSMEGRALSPEWAGGVSMLSIGIVWKEFVAAATTKFVFFSCRRAHRNLRIAEK